MTYGNCPEISHTNFSGKMAYANSADRNQTAPEGEVRSGSTLFAIPLRSFFVKLKHIKNTSK